MKYRPEVDGLRAVAVVPVILFHAGFTAFSGGFVGVDIFFVISGYLITNIILAELAAGEFSLARFYERRARRILPALFFMMLVTLPFAFFWLFPSDFKDFSQSLVAVTTFCSNILFWFETGYWGVENELKPLLHTWSLAVEEQYYFFFPLFMMAMWRFKSNRIFLALLIIALLSMLLSQWAVSRYPTANFFLLPTRAWELAIGAMIALFMHSRGAGAFPHKPLLSNILSLTGVGLIAWSIFAFSEHTPFPGMNALLPTVGAGLVILFASRGTLTGRMLSSPVFVKVGLISYSAYLWHQPLFALARQRVLTEPDRLTFVTLILATFVAAYFSWRFVERPFRSKTSVSRRAVVAFSVIGSLSFFGIGVAGYKTNGFEGMALNRGISEQQIAQNLSVNNGLSTDCRTEFTLSPKCRTHEQPEVLVWGDSYAMHIVGGMVASNPDAKLIQMTKGVCGPLFDVSPLSTRYPLAWAKECLKFNADVKAWLETNESLKYVVLSSPLDQYLKTSDKLLTREGRIIETGAEVLAAQMRNTLNELIAMGLTPVVFSPPPANGVDLGRCLAKATWNGVDPDQCNFAEQNISHYRKLSYQVLDTLSAEYNVVMLDELLCEEGTCHTHLAGTWLYRDSGHLSKKGSALLGEMYNFYGLVEAQPRELHTATSSK